MAFYIEAGRHISIRWFFFGYLLFVCHFLAVFLCWFWLHAAAFCFYFVRIVFTFWFFPQFHFSTHLFDLYGTHMFLRFCFSQSDNEKKNRNFSLVPIIFDSCTFRHFISVVPLLSTFAFLLIFSTNSQQFLVFFSRLFRFGCYSLWCVCGSLIKFFCTSPPPVLCSLFVIVDCRKAQSLMRTNSNVCVKQSYSMWFWKCICSRNRAQENFFPILVSLLPLSHRNSHPSHHHTFFRIYVDIMSFFSVNCY